MLPRQPGAARRLGVPLNEIWISDGHREQQERILFHELAEIEYRSRGYTARKAHRMALAEEESRFGERAG